MPGNLTIWRWHKAFVDGRESAEFKSRGDTLQTVGAATNMYTVIAVKAGTDYGTYSAAQPDAVAKNMMFISVDSQQTCYEYVLRQSCIAAERTKNCWFSG